MKTFEIGKSYAINNAYQHGTITVEKRTAKFLTYTYCGLTFKSAIRTDGDCEYILVAKSKSVECKAADVETSASETATPDAPQEAANNELEAEAPKQAATDNEQEETKMTLEKLYALTLNNLDADDGDIVGVAVYTDGGDTVEDFNDVRDVINRYGNREIEPILFDDYPVSMTKPDAHGMIHIALVDKETVAKETPRSVQETRLDVAAFYEKYVEEYGFCKDNGDNVAGFCEAVKAFSVFTESEANAAFVREFCAYMGDYITSDREAAAFMFALESMTAPPMCETEPEAKPATEFNYDYLSGRYAIFNHANGVFSNEYETDDLKEARERLKEEWEGSLESGAFAIFDRDARQYIQIRATSKGRKAFKAENERLIAKAATPVNQTEDSAEAGQPAPQEDAEPKPKAKPPKSYTVRVNCDYGKPYEIAGTLEELIEKFAYTLKKGKSWERECGNRKINLTPKTARSLIANLQNASDNAAANGYSGVHYELVTATKPGGFPRRVGGITSASPE